LVNELEFLDAPDVINSLFNTPFNQDTTIENPDNVFKFNKNERYVEYFLFSGEKDEPLIFFCPAEYDTLKDILEFASGIKKLGFHVVTFTYQQNKEKPDNISGLFELIEDIYADFMENEGCEEKRQFKQIFIMGRSLGASLALNLGVCHCKETTGLIMESAFDKTDIFLKRQGIIFPEGSDVTKNKEKMKCYTKPVLFLHSSRDELQSLTEIEWLVLESRSKGTQFQIMPAPDRKYFMRLFEDAYLEFIKSFIWQKIGKRPKKRYSKQQ